MMLRQPRRLSRQATTMAKRCAILYTTMLIIPLVGIAISAYTAYAQLSDGKAAMIGFSPYGIDLEGRMFSFLFAVGVIWFVGFFDVELCHGVSRRSFVNASLIAGAVVSAAATLVLMPVRYMGIAMTRSAQSIPQSGKSVLAYLESSRSDRFQYAWAHCRDLDSWTSGSLCETSSIVSYDWLYISMKFFSLMLIVTALGMLVGAVMAWVVNGNTVRRIGGVVLLGMVIVIVELMRPVWYAGDSYNAALPRVVHWTRNVLAGIVIRYTDSGGQDMTYVAWIALVFSLLLFAICAFIVDRMTLHREIHSSRHRAI